MKKAGEHNCIRGGTAEVICRSKERAIQRPDYQRVRHGVSDSSKLKRGKKINPKLQRKLTVKRIF
jgi:hypothetical protein